MNADELARSVQSQGVAQAVAAGCAARGDGRGRWSREVGGATEVLFDLASLTKPMTAVSFVTRGSHSSIGPCHEARAAAGEPEPPPSYSGSAG